jgi:uncharacterized protein YcaQ
MRPTQFVPRHRDRLVARVDPLFDRKAGVLRVRQVYAEEGATENAGAVSPVSTHIQSLTSRAL